MKSKRSIIFIALLLLVIFVTSAFSYARYVNSQTINGTITTVERVYDVNYSIYFYKDDTLQEADTENYTVHCDALSDDYCYDGGVEVNYTVDNGKYDGYYYNDNDCYLYSSCDYSDFLSDGGTINLYYDPLPYYEVQYYIDGVLQSGDTETSYGIPGDDYIYPSFNTSMYEGYDFIYAEIEGSTYFPGDDLPYVSNGATIYVYYEETLAYCGFRGTPSAGDTVVHGDYIYTYMLTPWIDVEGYMDSGDTSTSNLLNYISMEGMSSGWSVRVNDTSKSSPITSQICSTITDDENEEPITSTNLMYFMSASSSVDVSTLNSSNVTQSQAMFAFNNISNITGLNLMNTTNITDMSGMFSGNQITSLNLTNFDTSNVTNMAVMFYGSQLTSINVSSFNTSNVQDMTVMFGNLQYLQSLDLSNFNTSNVYSMYSMFGNCSSLSSLNISSFNTSHVLSMNSMFWNCSNLTTLDLSGFNTQSLVDMTAIFRNCSSIISLDLGSFDLSNVNDYEYAFDGMTSLNLIRTPSVNPSSGSIIQLPNIFTDGQLLYMNIGQQLLGDDSMDMIEFYNSPTNTVLQRTTVSILKTGNNVNTILKTLAGNDTNESDIDENIKYIVKSNTSPSSSNMTDDNIISLGGDDMLMPTYAWVNGNVLYYYTNAQILVANPNSSNLFKGFESLEYLDLSGMNFSLILMQNNFFDGDNSLETIITPSVNPAYAYNDVIIPLPATFKDDEDNCYVFIGYNTSQMDYGSPTSTELNRSTASMLKTGQEIQELFNEIGKSNVYNITHYSGVPDQTILSQSAIISIDSSDDTFGYFADLLVPTYAWYDMNSGTLYYYSEAESIFLHPNSAQLFSLLTSLQSIDFDFKGDFLVAASAMFSANNSLTSLDLSNFKAPKIQYMGHMFDSCGYIEELDLSGFDLSNIQEEGEIPAYEYAFNSMNSLDTIITPSKNPSNGINIELPAAFKDSNGNVYMYLGSNMGFYNTPNNIEITKTTVSILDTGNSVNDKLKSIIGNAVFDGDFYVDESIKYIVKSNNPPSSNIINDNYNIATSEIPVYPTYAWADNDTLYYYSPAEYIFMNPNSEILFAAFNSLETIDLQFRTDLVTRMGGMFLGDSSLETLNLSSFNTSNTTNMRYMFQECNNLISLNLSSFNTSKVTDMSGMFYGIGVHTLNLSNFDTSKVNNFENMFNGCTELETLDLSEFDTSSVTDMFGMFYKCGNLVSLDISNFDTTNVTDMSSMFYGCQSIKKLDLSSFNLTNLSNSSSIFDGTSELREIVTPASMGSVPLVLYDTMYDIDDNEYTQIDSTTPTNISIYVRFIAEFDTGQNVNAILKDLAGNNGATYETVDTNVTKIVRTNIEPDNHYELINSDDSEYKIKAFYEDGIIYYWTDATIINLNSDASNMFSDFSNLELVDVSTTRAENSQNIMNMFSHSPVKTLYARNRATVELIQYYSSVVDTNSDTAVMTIRKECFTDLTLDYGDNISIGQYTYYKGQELIADLNTYLATNELLFQNNDINGYSVRVKDTSSTSSLVGGVCKYINNEPITSMSLMYAMSQSPVIDTSEIDSSLVTNMFGMFGMSSASSIDVSSLNTSNVTNMMGMFNGSSVDELDLSSFDTSKVTDMSGMFYNNRNIEVLDLSSFDTSNVTNMMGMFSLMENLTTLDTSLFNTSKVTDISYIFNNCNSLIALDLGSFDLSSVSSYDRALYNMTSLNLIRTPSVNPNRNISIDLPTIFGDETYLYQYLGNNQGMYYSPLNSVIMAKTYSVLLPGSIVNNKIKYLAGDDVSNADPIVQNSTIEHIVYSSTAPDLNDMTDDNIISVSEIDIANVLPTYIWIDGDTLYYYSPANIILAFNDSESLFAGFSSLRDIDLNIRTDIVTDMDYMFAQDSMLTSIDLSNFNLMSVESAENVFYGDYLISEVKTPIVNPPQSIGIKLLGLYRDSNNNLYMYIGNNEGVYYSPTNTTLYQSSFAQLDTGENVNNKLKALAGNTVGDELVTDTTIRHIVYSSVAPDPNDMTEDNVISYYYDDMYGHVYAWVDGNTLYYYSNVDFIILNSDSYGLLAGFLAVEDIDIHFRTDIVTNMSGMFAYDMSLEELDLSGFVTLMAQDMRGMFYNCSSLEELDLRSFDTKSLVNTEYMFEGVTTRTGFAHTSNDARKFNNSLNKPQLLIFNYEVESGRPAEVFATGCHYDGELYNGLEFINGQYKYSYGKYYDWFDNMLTSLPGAWHVALVDKESTSPVNTPICKTINEKPVTSMEGMFSGSSASTVDFTMLNTSSITNMVGLFANYENLDKVDLTYLDTSNVEYMYGMFALNDVTTLDVSNFDTSKVKNMSGMFAGCSNLTSIDLSNFDMNNVENADGMFGGSYWGNNNINKIKTPYNIHLSGNTAIILGKDYVDSNNNHYSVIDYTTPSKTWLEVSNIALLDIGENVNMKLKILSGSGNSYSSEDNNIISIQKSNNAPSSNNKTNNNLISINKIPVYAWYDNGIIYYYSEASNIYFNSDSSRIFYRMSSLENIDLSGFDLSLVTVSNDIFTYDESIESLITPKVMGNHSIALPCIMEDTNNTVYTQLNNSTSINTLLTKSNNIALLDTGENINIKLKILSGSGSSYYDFDNTILSIQRSSVAPNLNNMTNDNLISIGTIPVYAWYNGGTIYYYSEAQTIYLNKDSSSMFRRLSGLITLYINSFDTSNANNMSDMFESCSSLTSLDISSFNTSNVTNMSGMFAGCSNLTTLDLSSFDTSNVTSMNYMFYECNSLTSLDISSFNTTNVKQMEFMFSFCMNLITLDLSNFEISNLYYSGSQNILSNLSSDISIKTPKAMNSNEIELPKTMVDGSGNYYNYLDIHTPTRTMLYSADIAQLDEGSSLNTKMFKIANGDLKNIYRIQRSYSLPQLNDDNIISVNKIPVYAWYQNNTLYYYSTSQTIYLNVDTSGLFRDMTQLTYIDLSDFDSRYVENINNLFSKCSSLTSLDLSNFDLSNVREISSVFENDISLNTLITPKAMPNYNILLPKTMIDGSGNMYDYIESSTPTNIALTSMNIAQLDTGRNINGKLKKLAGSRYNDWSQANTNILSIERSYNLPNINSMTSDNIISVNDVPVYAWYDNNTIYYYSDANVIYLNYNSSNMFYNMKSLSSIDLNSFDTTKVGYMYEMFAECENLNQLDLSSFDTSNVTEIYGMFRNCSALETIYVSELWNVSNVPYDYDSYLNIFNYCYNLVGGSGTTYDSYMDEDTTYARVDKKVYDSNTGTWSEDTTKPGLLTLKSSGSLGLNGLSNSLNTVASSDSLFNSIKAIIKSVLVKIRVLKKYLIIVNPLIRD